MFLTPFRKEIRIRSVQPASVTTTCTGIKAVVVDEPVELPNGDKASLHAYVGCGSLYCCDYILLAHSDGDEKRLLFVEVSNLKRKRSDLHKRYESIEDNDFRNETIEKEIFQEHILKAYGSLVILFRLPIISRINWEGLTEQDPDTAGRRKRLLNRKAIFCIVVSDLEVEENPEAFDSLKTSLASGLRPLVSEVHVLGQDKFMQNYCRRTWTAKNTVTNTDK